MQLKIYYYYQLDTATEEGFRHIEHHVTKITILENAGFCKSGHIFHGFCSYCELPLLIFYLHIEIFHIPYGGKLWRVLTLAKWQGKHHWRNKLWRIDDESLIKCILK